MSINWVCKHHTSLSSQELYAILQLRTEVFVVEQECPFQETDGLDLKGDTCHLMGWQDGSLTAYLRLLDPPSHGGETVICRVVTAPSARGKGLGHELISQGLLHAGKVWPSAPIYLSAQAHLQKYYARYGFVAEGEEYLEDGIPHIDMRRPSMELH